MDAPRRDGEFLSPSNSSDPARSLWRRSQTRSQREPLRITRSHISRRQWSLRLLRLMPWMATTTKALSAARNSILASHMVRPLHVQTQELTLRCSDNIQLAAQQWTLQEGRRRHSDGSLSGTQQSAEQRRERNILCLHGWMDNSASFHLFAPRLLQQLHPPHAEDSHSTTTIVAIDLPGHGRSSHKSIDGPPMVLAEAVFYVAEALRLLQWVPPLTAPTERTSDSTPHDNHHNHSPRTVTLVGHSMGAAVASLTAATLGDVVQNLVLLEGGAPLPRPVDHLLRSVRTHVQVRQESLLRQESPRRVYPDLARAVTARRQTARRWPGEQSISQSAAEALVARGSRPTDDGGVVFRHDPRLQWPSLHYWTRDMVRVLYQQLAAQQVQKTEGSQLRVGVLLAQKGWPRSEEDDADFRELLHPQLLQVLPGSHHFHADPETAEAVADRVAQFLREQPGPNVNQQIQAGL